MSLTTLTTEELYREIADLARDQGVAEKPRWAELVEEVVESHLSLGEIDLDEDTEGLKEALSSRWPSYKEELSEETGEEDKGLLDAEDREDEEEEEEEID